jgi:hypothetical protein
VSSHKNQGGLLRPPLVDTDHLRDAGLASSQDDSSFEQPLPFLCRCDCGKRDCGLGMNNGFLFARGCR